MPDSDIPVQARMHTSITRRVGFVAKSIHRDWDVYLATYTSGRNGQPYQLAEERSGDDFYSIRAYEHEPSRATHVKDLDAIIIEGDRVIFMIEVKWGTVPSNRKTDLDLKPDELDKMRRLMASPTVCRVRGPAVKAGRRYRSEEFSVVKDYDTDNETKLILVSDFQRTKTAMPTELTKFQRVARRMEATFQIADIECRVGEIPSLREILEAASQTTAT